MRCLAGDVLCRRTQLSIAGSGYRLTPSGPSTFSVMMFYKKKLRVVYLQHRHTLTVQRACPVIVKYMLDTPSASKICTRHKK